MKATTETRRTELDAYPKLVEYLLEKTETPLRIDNAPIGVFQQDGMSALEAISVYLKDRKNLRLSEIAELLNRDDRTIWGAYHRGLRKAREDPHFDDRFMVPVSVLNDRTYSLLEAVTKYLKEEFGLRYCQISLLINKDQRTVWTLYKRVKIKDRNGL